MPGWNGCNMSDDPIPVAAPEPTPGPGKPGKEKAAIPIPVLAGVIFGAIVLAVLFLLSGRQQAPEPPQPLSEEALAYSAQVLLTDMRMSAEANFLGQEIVYLDGKITNGGSKAVRQLVVRLFFYDVLSQVVLKEDRDVLRPSSTPLAPGEARDFQLRMDRLPLSWNRGAPQWQLISLEIQ